MSPVLSQSDLPRSSSRAPICLGVLNGFPEKEGHTAQGVQPCIRAAVLVDDTIAVNEGQNPSGRPTVLGGNADREVFTEALDEVAKPRQRLQRPPVTLTSEGQEMAKFAEQRLAP